MNDIKTINLVPSIPLLDQMGVQVHSICTHDANLLMKRQVAELLFKIPPQLRLLIPLSEYNSKYRKLRKTVSLNYIKDQYYQGITFQSKNGVTMFHCNARKALWYMHRGLVEVVSEKPPVLRFLNETKGPGHEGDRFYLGQKLNICVVCGSTDQLTRHHVMPFVFRKFMPQEVKDHSYHDILLTCQECHYKYEIHADKLKAELLAEHGLSAHGEDAWILPDQWFAVAQANALVEYGSKIPTERKKRLLELVQEVFGPQTEDSLKELAKLYGENKKKTSLVRNPKYLSYGQQVVGKIEDLQQFTEMWRQHFLDKMEPKFMPEGWELHRSVYRDKIPK